MDLFTPNILKLELFFQKFFEFSKELYKEIHSIKQKLIEIEILDITEQKTWSFLKEINNFLLDITNIIAPFSSRLLIKIKENSGIMSSYELFQNKNNINNNIVQKFLEFLNFCDGSEIFILAKSKNRLIEITKANRRTKKFDIISYDQFFNEKNESFAAKREYYFIIIANTYNNYDFRKTMDFFKIWSIFNGDINIIAKYFPKNVLKTLLNVDFPLLSKEIIKIFQLHTIFSLYLDNDCLLMNILEEQKFDFSNYVYVNCLQFLNNLNLEESLMLFKKVFSIDKDLSTQKRIKIEQSSIDLQLDILVGTNFHLKEDSFYVFAFNNNSILFDNIRNGKQNCLNQIVIKCLQSLDMKPYGYATIFLRNETEDDQENYFKKLILNQITNKKKIKLTKHSIFLVLNIIIDSKQLESIISKDLKSFIKDWIQEKIYEVFDEFKKKNDFQCFITAREKKLIEIVNYDIPKISNYLEKISMFLQSNFNLPESGKNYPNSSLEFNKILWGKTLFEK